MPTLIVLVVIAVLALFYFYMKSKNKEKNTSSDDNLRRIFGEDYKRISGNTDTTPYIPAVQKDFSEPKAAAFTNQEKVSPIDDILKRKAPQISNTAIYGDSPVNAVINQKMSGASFLGIRINVINGGAIPKNAGKQFCNLVSVMLAKGIGACAKSESKVISFSVEEYEKEAVITCTYPSRAIPETDEKIKAMTVALKGSLSSEETDGATTDKSVIPADEILK